MFGEFFFRHSKQMIILFTSDRFREEDNKIAAECLKNKNNGDTQLLFLNFCINTQNISSTELSTELAELYIKKLTEILGGRKKTVPKKKEDGEVKTFREGLYNVIGKMTSYELRENDKGVPDYLFEEYALFFLRINKRNELFDHFKKRIYKVSLRIASKFFWQITGEASDAMFINFLSVLNERSTVRMIKFINMNVDMIDISKVDNSLLCDIKLHMIKDFVKYNADDRVNHHRRRVIKNVSFESAIAQARQRLEYFIGGYDEIIQQTICAICGRSVVNQNIKILTNNTIYHTDCTKEIEPHKGSKSFPGKLSYRISGILHRTFH